MESYHIFEISRYSKSIVDDPVIDCDKIVHVANSVRTNVTNTVAKNVTSTMSINFRNKKVRYKMDRFILDKFLLVTILLFIITTICYHYAKHRSK